MIETILKNIAYSYYPKGLCSANDYEEYMQSKEFKSLSRVIDQQLSDINFKNSRLELLQQFRKHKDLKDISDVTREPHDRCLTFEIEIVELNKLIKVCINVSLLIPYYFIYVLKNDIDIESGCKWLNLPKRDKESEEKYIELIKLLQYITEGQMQFNLFPESLVDVIIPEINYVDIELGKFTLYNAFFLDYINL